MDYDRCVAHTMQGRYKGQRCKKKGVQSIWPGSKFKSCGNHDTYYIRYSPPWVKDILERNILGRYNHA